MAENCCRRDVRIPSSAGAANVLLGRLFEITSAGVSSRHSRSSRIPNFGCRPDGDPSLTQFVNHQPRRLTTIGFDVGGVSRPMVWISPLRSRRFSLRKRRRFGALVVPAADIAQKRCMPRVGVRYRRARG
jgi:hypothetical protein